MAIFISKKINGSDSKAQNRVRSPLWIKMKNFSEYWGNSAEDVSRTLRTNSLPSFVNPNGGKRSLTRSLLRVGLSELFRMPTSVTRSKRLSVHSSHVFNKRNVRNLSWKLNVSKMPASP